MKWIRLEQTVRVFLFGMLVAGAGAIWAINDPGRYVKTDGTVVHTALKQSELGTVLRMAYSYQVGEKTYQSMNNPQFDEPFKSHQDALNKQAEYWPGRTLPVYYEADSPWMATAKPSPWRPGWAIFSIGLGIALLGLLGSLP